MVIAQQQRKEDYFNPTYGITIIEVIFGPVTINQKREFDPIWNLDKRCALRYSFVTHMY